MVSVSHECIELDEKDVPREADLEQSLARLPPGTPLLALDVATPDKVHVPLISIASISLIHPLLASPFLSQKNTWNLLATISQSLGMMHKLGPFMTWLQASTVNPPLTVNALESSDLADSNLQQRQDISQAFVPAPPPPHPDFNTKG